MRREHPDHNKSMKDKTHKAKANKEQSDGPKGNNMAKVKRTIEEQNAQAKALTENLNRSIEAYFIGPRGENIDFFKYMINRAIDSHLAARV